MDKYEYKSKTEPDSRTYGERRVQQSGGDRGIRGIDLESACAMPVMLSNAVEIYEKTGEYQKGYDILTLAYQRAEGSRKIISRLCGLALKTGNVDRGDRFLR